MLKHIQIPPLHRRKSCFDSPHPAKGSCMHTAHVAYECMMQATCICQAHMQPHAYLALVDQPYCGHVWTLKDTHGHFLGQHGHVWGSLMCVFWVSLGFVGFRKAVSISWGQPGPFVIVSQPETKLRNRNNFRFVASPGPSWAADQF